MTDPRSAPPDPSPRPDAPSPQAGRGRLKVFFGAWPGVGKTHAMLAAAQALRDEGIDVVAGIVETHGRPETQALADGLAQLPGKPAPGEFDLDAALARKPALILVDELAHANLPGARHARRWQDVEALLAAGIDVWTTLDVQHLETLNGVIKGISGLSSGDTVPDRVFDAADDVVVVDLQPDELLQRLKEGKVHLPSRAAPAAKAFFRKGNLIALRELARRRVAGRSTTPLAVRATRQRKAGRSAPPVLHERQREAGSRWRPYAGSAAACAMVTLLTAPLHGVLDLPNIVMLFLLAVMLVALRLGRGPAVLATLLSVAAFDYFFVPPRLTFSVSDAQYVLTFAVMLAVALVIGQLTAGLKLQAQVSTQREARVRALYEMSRDLSGALIVEQVAEIGARFLAAEFSARATLYVPDATDRLLPPVPLAGAPQALDASAAQQAFDLGEPAGCGTTLHAAAPVLYLPLQAPMRVRGVLAIEPGIAGALADPDARRVLDTCASLLAVSLERIHYVEVAQSATVQMESERLRNSLLAAISHDLRTPLAALVGMADSLAVTAPPARQADIVQAIHAAALRMNAQVNNLLDMARLQSGQVRLNRQWLPLEEVLGSALRGLEGSLPPERVRVQLPADLPLLQLDPALFERVLWNLLENAAKYTPPGSLIEIAAAEQGDRMRITIDDHGPGLPPQREAAIFEMFERGHAESVTPGVGLGLAICRAIVEAHGGAIRGATRPEGGARFIIELPLGTPPSLEGLEPGEEVAAASPGERIAP